ncbi:hypothetical protein HGA88_01670 [Candidatus Roizmanbacteria bacterium]|nr:hypothetical protein [Candidatus Roizmanbacteria bacterium]
MKLIVTHTSPDLDAATASWLIRRFLPGWSEAEHSFVFSGSTLEDKDPDENPDIIHVDTGGGKFDHHQTSAYVSATHLVFKYLLTQKTFKEETEHALERMVAYVNASDHFFEVSFPDPDNDRYDFNFSIYSENIKPTIKEDHAILEFMFTNLDIIFQTFRAKVIAEKEMKEGFVFTSKYGKTLAVESSNEVVTKLAQKKGFTAVIRKHPVKGNLSIKTIPSTEYDLTPFYEKLIKEDTIGTWYLHVSKNMLLNGSTRNPAMVPSPLSLARVVEILKQIR